jgi:hypothetical protein
MSDTWLQIEIQDGSGSPAGSGKSGDVTIRNDSGIRAFVVTGQLGSPGHKQISLDINTSTDVVRTPNTDLIVQVARYVNTCAPSSTVGTIGSLELCTADRTLLSSENLTRLWGAGSPEKPTFAIDPNGVFITISLV